MGREGLVSRSEAAGLLGVSVKRVSQMTRHGLLRVASTDGPPLSTEILYDLEEVSALAEARERGTSVPETHQMACQAWAAARVAQRRVETLERLLGLNLGGLDYSAEALRALHQRAEEDLDKPAGGAKIVNFWADQLFRICDIYLGEVAKLGFEEPHEPYLSLANRLMATEDPGTPDPTEHLAYRRLESARARFRCTIFAYYLRVEGKRKVFDRFPSEFQGPHYDIMMLATE